MPASADPPVPADPAVESPPLPPEEPLPGQRLAVLAESLYLTNLLLLPGLAFAALAWLYLHRHGTAPRLARAHLRQALSASLWAGVLLVLVNLVILLIGGYQGVHTWVIVILYFTFLHSTLVVLGMVGLAKAMSGQVWTMPLFGRFPFITGTGPETP